MFNKDLQELNNKQTVMNNTVTEMKNTLEGINNFTICMETQKTSNSQSNLEKEKQSWRNQAP